jgi:hypothetical protein
MQPISRDARRDEYECAKYPQVLLMKSRRLPSKKIGLRPQMTAIDCVKKHDTPMTKIPQPRPPLRVLYDMSNCLLIKTYPGEIIGPYHQSAWPIKFGTHLPMPQLPQYQCKSKKASSLSSIMAN